jgi:hypothetical protein
MKELTLASQGIRVGCWVIGEGTVACNLFIFLHTGGKIRRKKKTREEEKRRRHKVEARQRRKMASRGLILDGN